MIGELGRVVSSSHSHSKLLFGVARCDGEKPNIPRVYDCDEAGELDVGVWMACGKDGIL
jgi:hypothetical protein